jgi:folate-binding protein YgfZ
MLSPAPMPFKTIRAAKAVPRLSGFSILGFAGPDAGPFLQAQTMNDVRGLSVGQWQWNGWLSAKGRVIALFALLKLADDEFVAVLPDFPAQQLQALLQRFVFRSKVKIQALAELVAAADFDFIDQGAARDLATGSKQSGLCLDFSGNDTRRCLVLLPEGHADLLPPNIDCDGKWLAADLAHGLPRLVESQVEAWTPQMLSLERLNAYSLKKGCYPGQEIVARTHYLGQAKRALSRVAGAGLELGGAIKDEQDVSFGSVVSVAPAAASGLAVVQSEKRVANAWSGGQPVTLPAFLDGLQRPV